MSRSFKKGSFVASHILKKLKNQRNLKTKIIFKTWSRSTTIIESMVGSTFGVYNGHQHIPIFITDQCIGHKFGEFAPTRTFYAHVTKDKKGKRS